MLSTKDPAFRSQAGLVALEAFLIVLGVALAYLSTAWYERSKEAAEAEQAMASILAEIQENRATVQGSLDYHDSVRTAILSALRAGRSPERSAFPRGYVQPADLESIAWDLANSRGAISTLPYAQVLEVSRLYSDHELYLETARDVGGLIYAAVFESGSQIILNRPTNLLEIVMTFLYRECQLLGHQTDVLVFLGAEEAAANEPPPQCAEMMRGREGD